MNRIDRTRCALVLVDFQQRLMPTIHEAVAAVDEAVFLGEVAKILGIRVLGTEQNPAGLGPNLPRIRDLCAVTLAKMHFDACKDGLLEALHHGEPEVGDVVIAGCEAHVCLLQTALGLRQAGRNVFVVAAACGSRLPRDHEVAMRRLEGAGAVITSPEMVAFEWLDSCKDAAFKAVLGLLKHRTAARSTAPSSAMQHAAAALGEG